MSSSTPLRVASSLFSFSFSLFSLRYWDFLCPKGVQEDSWGEILSVYQTCHLELSFFLHQACHVTLLFQVKTENPPLLFYLLISRFLSSVSIKPMTTMLMFLRCVGGGVCGCVCVCGSGMLICFVSALGSHEMGRHKLPIIIIIIIIIIYCKRKHSF